MRAAHSACARRRRRRTCGWRRRGTRPPAARGPARPCRSTPTLTPGPQSCMRKRVDTGGPHHRATTCGASALGASTTARQALRVIATQCKLMCCKYELGWQPGHTQLQGWQQRRSHRLTGYFRKAALVYAPIGAIHSQAAARAAHAFDVRQFWLMRLHAGECRQALKRAGLAVACTDNYVDTTKRPDAPVHGRQAATHASLCALVTALPARRLGGLDRQPAAGQWRPLQRDGGARAALPDHRAAAGLGGADPAHVLRALRPQLPPAQCARAGHAPALERRSGSSVFVTLFPSCTSAPACCVDSPVRQPT